MRTTLLLSFTLLLCVGPVAAQTPAALPATVPAVEENLPDLLDGAVDPYDAASERAKFYKAAGIDSELTKDQFGASMEKGGGFVRKFDRWQALASYDKNGNGKIDWFEADAYRKDVRKAVLDKFDADKDGKLAGQERKDANKALQNGWLRMGGARGKPVMAISDPGASGGDTAEGVGGVSGRGEKRTYEELLKKYDTDGDGKLSDEERKAMQEDFRRQAEEEQLAKYDTDGDGKLSDEERKVMEEDRRSQADTWKQWGKDLQLKHFDADGDGKLDEEEMAAFKEFEKELKKIGQEWELAQFDLDGDGKITPEERKEVQKQWLGATFKVLAKVARYMDADGDGKVSLEEREAFGKKLQEKAAQWTDKLLAKYDRNADDKLLDPEERKALIAGLREEMAARTKKYDADGDGRLSPSEMINLVEDFVKEMGIEPRPLASSKPAE